MSTMGVKKQNDAPTRVSKKCVDMFILLDSLIGTGLTHIIGTTTTRSACIECWLVIKMKVFYFSWPCHGTIPWLSMSSTHTVKYAQTVTYKLAVLTHKFRHTSTVYVHDRILEHVHSRTLRSSANPLLVQPFTKTDFSRRAFRFSAPSVWNSLTQTVLISDSVGF